MSLQEPYREVLYADDHLPMLILSEGLVKNFFHNSWWCISITETINNDTKIGGSCSKILRLKFDDVEAGDEVGYEKAITKEQAQQIADFAKAFHQSDAQLLVIHCMAGWSRSPAVGAAISTFFNADDKAFYLHYDPNRTVYRAVFNALHGEQF